MPDLFNSKNSPGPTPQIPNHAAADFCQLKICVSRFTRRIDSVLNDQKMKINITLIALMIGCSLVLQAQSVEELTQQRDTKATELATLQGQLAELQGQVDGLQGEVDALTEQITPYPRWTTAAFGTIGLNIANFNDWLGKGQPNTSAVTIGLTANGIANMLEENYFWRNSLGINLGWIKFDDKDDDTDNEDFQAAADAFNVVSHFGYNLSPKLAISVLGEYRSTLIDNFNNPGYLDIGTGITWLPMDALVVVIHPFNYNIIFADDKDLYESSTGAKIVADYAQQITDGVAWKSNLSAFLSYKDGDYSNWTWVNSFSTAIRGIGVGLDIGLRSAKQEALAQEPALTDNPLQTYWVLGLSYALGAK